MENNNKSITKKDTANDASMRLGRLIMQIRRLDSSPRTFGRAGALTPSEIHTIDAIGGSEGLLMSELAQRLGITKGAVTQIVDRLEAKKLVRRGPHPRVARGVQITLTDIGIDAYQAHLQMHKAYYDQLRETFTEREIEIFEQCIAKLSDILAE